MPKAVSTRIVEKLPTIQREMVADNQRVDSQRQDLGRRLSNAVRMGLLHLLRLKLIATFLKHDGDDDDEAATCRRLGELEDRLSVDSLMS